MAPPTVLHMPTMTFTVRPQEPRRGEAQPLPRSIRDLPAWAATHPALAKLMAPSQPPRAGRFAQTPRKVVQPAGPSEPAVVAEATTMPLLPQQITRVRIEGGTTHVAYKSAAGEMARWAGDSATMPAGRPIKAVRTAKIFLRMAAVIADRMLKENPAREIQFTESGIQVLAKDTNADGRVDTLALVVMTDQHLFIVTVNPSSPYVSHAMMKETGWNAVQFGDARVAKQ